MAYEPKKAKDKEPAKPLSVRTIPVKRGKFMDGGSHWPAGDEGGRTVYQEGSVLPRPRVRVGDWMK